MKTTSGLLLGLSIVFCAQGQLTIIPSAESSTHFIAGRGANHRVFARVAYETNKIGKVVARTNATYTELETGMHFFKDGEWRPSSAEIEITATGAIAQNTRHKVVFAGNINAAEAVKLTLAEGGELKSHILGLSYESSDGKSVLIAELKDSQGLLLPSKDKIIYPDAFTDVKADILYEVKKAGVSQSVVFREQLPSPSEWGLDPATTRLQILTEFINPPEPVKEQVVIDQQAGLTDERRLDFGEMKMGRGTAFALGAGANQKSGVPVAKQWTVLSGRNFLVEEVQYSPIENSLKVLPEKPQASLPDAKKFQNVASIERKLPALPTGKSDKPVEVAQLDIYAQPGFVLDYEALASQTNFTFKGDTTYFCSGDVYLDGTSTIEGGTVVKFGRRYSSGGMCGNDDPAGTISFNGPIDCRTTAYRPAIFTAMDDDTVGATISGSSGTPNLYFGASGYYGGNYSEFHGGDNDVLRVSENGTDLRHLRVSWLTSGFRFPDSGDVYLRDIQMLNCYVGMKGGADLHIQNGLFANIVTLFWCGGCSEEEPWGMPVNVHGENLTIDGCANFAFGYAYYNLIFLTNSLLLGVPDETMCTLTTDHIASVDGSAFQSVGAGNYYLADNTYRNAGTTNINSWLLGELKKTTTYPPTILTNAITTNTTLSIQALRDTNAFPALGYHYDPIDYAINTLVVTNATLTIAPGTAIATFGDSGVRLWNNASLVCTGTPLDHIHFVRYYAVQEQAIVWGDATNLLSTYTILPVLNANPLPTASFRFTDFDGMSGGGYHFFSSQGWGLNAVVRDCAFDSAQSFFGGAPSSTLTLNNNLFERSAVSFSYNATILAYNNLFKYGSVYFENYGLTAWTLKDNAFDSCALSVESSESVTHSHNAYINASGRLYPTNASDIVLTNFTYASGTLGDYYQPTNSAFINRGSRTADLSGLYHYTVATRAFI